MARIHTTAIGPSGEIVEFIDPSTGRVKVTGGGGGGGIEGPIEVTGLEGQAVVVSGEVSTTPNGIGSGSLYGSLTVTTSPTELRVGATPLADRIFVMIVNTSDNDIYVGFNSSVTTSNGIPIFANNERAFELNKLSPVSLYAIAEVNSSIRIAEVK